MKHEVPIECPISSLSGASKDIDQNPMEIRGMIRFLE